MSTQLALLDAEPRAAPLPPPRAVPGRLSPAQRVLAARIEKALPAGVVLGAAAWKAILGACDGYAATIVSDLALPPWPPKAPKRPGRSGPRR